MVDEVVQDFILPCSHRIPCRLHFTEGAFAHILIPFPELDFCRFPIQSGTPEDGPEPVRDVVSLFEFRIELKQGVHSCVLPFAPFVWCLGEGISASFEKFVARVAIAQRGRSEPLVLPQWLAATSLALVVLRVLLAVTSASCGISLETSAVFEFKPALFRLRLASVTETYLFHAVNAALHDVEAVQCQNRIGEGRMRNDRHSVGKIGCHLLNPQSLFLGYLERDCQHILRLCASHGCYQRALTAMAVLVRQEREQVVLE